MNKLLNPLILVIIFYLLAGGITRAQWFDFPVSEKEILYSFGPGIGGPEGRGIRYMKKPVYTLNEEGEFLFKMTISPSGRIGNLFKPETDQPELVKAATDALKHWKFTPDTNSNVPYLETYIKVQFRINTTGSQVEYKYHAVDSIPLGNSRFTFGPGLLPSDGRGFVSIREPIFETSEQVQIRFNFTIMQDGSVSDITGLNGRPDLVRAGKRAISEWRFTAVKRKAKPLKTYVIIEFRPDQ